MVKSEDSVGTHNMANSTFSKQSAKFLHCDAAVSVPNGCHGLIHLRDIALIRWRRIAIMQTVSNEEVNTIAAIATREQLSSDARCHSFVI
jgi:hypothetical protein